MSLSPFKEPNEIIQKMMKVYIEKVNDARDLHVSRLTYEECLDPRHGMVEGMKAVFDMLENYFIGQISDDNER